MIMLDYNNQNNKHNNNMSILRIIIVGTYLFDISYHDVYNVY